MFKTSHVVYLVIVFFLMRHFKVFNMIDKKTKIKDKNYLLAFTFAVLLFGAHVLEMFVHELVKRVPMLKLPRFMDDRIYVDVPIVEGHAPLCQMKYGAPNTPISEWTPANTTTENITTGTAPADSDADCIYNLGDVTEGVSRWRHKDGTDNICGCDPSTADAEDVNPFKIDAPTEDQVLRSCNSGQLEVGICSAAAEQGTNPGDDLPCCHSQKVTNYYTYLQGLWDDHADPSSLNLDGHESVRLQGAIAAAQYGAHRSAQIGSVNEDGTIAARIAGELNLGTYTVPGRGGGGGGGGNAPDEPSVEPMCNDPADGTRSNCAWDARLAADGSEDPIPVGSRTEDACPSPCVFVAR